MISIILQYTLIIVNIRKKNCRNRQIDSAVFGDYINKKRQHLLPFDYFLIKNINTVSIIRNAKLKAEKSFT